MKTSSLIFVFSLLSFTLISCDLFKPVDHDFFKKIDAEIAWANAAKLKVTVAVPTGWGTSPQAGTDRCIDAVRTKETPRTGYPFVIEFTPELAYGLDEWRVYLSSSIPENWASDPSSLDEIDTIDESLFSVPELSARGGSGNFTVNTPLPVTLVPWCKPEPYILRTSPRDLAEDIPWNTDIVIYFNAPLALAPNIELPDLFEDSGKISIRAKSLNSENDDYYNISENNDYYNYPVYTASLDRGEYKITISPSNAPGDSLIELSVGKDIFNTFNVPMAMEEVFSFVIEARLSGGQINDWEAEYNGNSIKVNYSKSLAESTEVKARYRIDSGSDNEIPSTGIQETKNENEVKCDFTIPNVSMPDFSRVRQGGEISGIREYEIFLDLYIEGAKSNANSISFKIWNIATPALGGIAAGSGMKLISVDSNSRPILLDQNTGLEPIRDDITGLYVLTENITLDAYIPINNFAGKLYGNGHTITIKGFDANLAGDIGLFSAILTIPLESNQPAALIRDLTVVYDISGNNSTALNARSFGGIAVETQRAVEFTNIQVKGSINLNCNTTEDVNVGGIVGYKSNETVIRNVYSGLNLTVNKKGTGGDTFVGGIAGNSEIWGSSPVSEVTITANIKLDQEAGLMYVGGLIGWFQRLGSITDIEFNGSLIASKTESGESYIGGIAGSSTQASTFTNCRVSGSIEIPNSFSSGGEVRLGGICGYTNGCTIINSWVKGDITSAKTGGGDLYCGGLVGYISTTIINSCWYEQGSIISDGSGSIRLGGVIGYIEGYTSTVSFTRSLASLVSASRAGDTVSVGGFAGWLYAGSLSNCYAHTEVRALGGIVSAGGLIGYWSTLRAETYRISRSYAKGNVSAAGSGSILAAGGLIGRIAMSNVEDTNQNQSTLAADMIINNCYALGNVSVDRVSLSGSDATYAGGLVGLIFGDEQLTTNTQKYTIEYSFAHGTVSAKSAVLGPVYSGGIIGRFDITDGNRTGTLQNSAALGTSVTAMGGGTLYVGRVYGDASSRVTTITANYARDTMFIGTLTPYTYNPYPPYIPLDGSSIPPRPINNTANLDGYGIPFTQLNDSNFWENTIGFGTQTGYWNYDTVSLGYPKLMDGFGRLMGGQ